MFYPNLFLGMYHLIVSCQSVRHISHKNVCFGCPGLYFVSCLNWQYEYQPLFCTRDGSYSSPRDTTHNNTYPGTIKSKIQIRHICKKLSQANIGNMQCGYIAEGSCSNPSSVINHMPTCYFLSPSHVNLMVL